MRKSATAGTLKVEIAVRNECIGVSFGSTSCPMGEGITTSDDNPI
jgi:hypothetical protein